MLKSDQDGIERQIQEDLNKAFKIRLKSDQDGIERTLDL